MSLNRHILPRIGGIAYPLTGWYHGGMQRRFALLAHTGHGPDHWDLMVQAGEALATWQLPQDPRNLLTGQSLACRRLGDHRQVYLDYQGEVSGGRGRVKRLDAGLCEVMEDGDVWRLVVGEGGLAGRWRLTRVQEPEAWELVREA